MNVNKLVEISNILLVSGTHQCFQLIETQQFTQNHIRTIFLWRRYIFWPHFEIMHHTYNFRSNFLRTFFSSRTNIFCEIENLLSHPTKRYFFVDNIISINKKVLQKVLKLVLYSKICSTFYFWLLSPQELAVDKTYNINIWAALWWCIFFLWRYFFLLGHVAISYTPEGQKLPSYKCNAPPKQLIWKSFCINKIMKASAKKSTSIG